MIGLAGRFPGASDVPSFWRNLLAGRDGVTRFTDEDLAAAGYDPAALRTDPGFVPARGVIDRPEWFDAAFFGIQPREAEAIDPQQRVFMETAWHALEDAGCDPKRYAGVIGVYAGMSFNSYGRFVRSRRDIMDAVGELIVTMGNEKDFLATRLAYKLNLRGPALSINTACSTSLVALVTACQSLAGYQCDTALTGGVSITFPQTRGYFFREGGMASPDGLCRPFDAKAAGAVFSHGCGVVVLKRLADALAEGDQIYAVVKGWALNNDGSAKVSMTAPSISGQAEAIALAQALAGAPPESISYVETHGTGTPLGDAIEVAALTQAFGAGASRGKFCALGSAKSNIGHLEAAAGAVGFIKAALMLRHGQMPATLHFESANPELKLDDSPFYVSPKTIEWPRGAGPRRAGVSSFGVGGTNAHAVLEEAPQQPATTAGRAVQLLPISARTAAAAEQAAQNLAAHLETNPGVPLADAAFTLQTGRQQFAERRCFVAGSTAEAIAALRAGTKLSRKDDRTGTPVAFIFPGQGSQYPRMGAQLYAAEPAFRDAFDCVAQLLQPEIGADLRSAIFSGGTEDLQQTRVTQPAIFAIEYALAQMWLSFGLRPDALLGHSVGEYAAATLAGVFTLPDAARLVAARARLVQEQPGGSMLAVRLGEAEAKEFAVGNVSIAAINSPRLCVLSGPTDAIAAVEAELAKRSVSARRLATSHAFHSEMVAPVVAPFAELVRAVPLRQPQIPFVSNITGDWITAEQATDPGYWASHVRAAVRFADGVGKLLDSSGRALLEVGPGNALTQLARQHPGKSTAHEFAHTLADEADEAETLATAQGRLWLAGVPLDWAAIHAGETRRRVSLPGYPFERQRYFADMPAGTPLPLTASSLDGEPLSTVSASSANAAPRREAPAPTVRTATPEPPNQSAFARLAALLREQTGTDYSGTDPSTTLLDLGFDSLFLAQLIVVIQKRFGVQISILDFFNELDSLGSLAAHLEKHAPAPPEREAPEPKAPAPKPVVETAAPKPAALGGPVPVAEAQREVWLACQRGPLASAAFNETCTVDFHGDFDVETMRRAIHAVVERHDALRTTFSDDGETQTIAAHWIPDVPVEDLSTMPAAERDRTFLARRKAEGSRRFDLARGPLLAARILRLTAGHHALIITAHHIACDGWSYDIVLRELGIIYTALRENRPHGLPAPMQMSDYQRWEAEQQRTASFAADKSYWLERFRTPPAPLDLPGDRPRPPQRSHAGSREHTTIPASLHREITLTGARLGATPFALLLAAFKALIFRLSGEEDFVVGVPAAGQNLAGGSDLVGHCVNLLALRSSVGGTEPFADFLRTTRNSLFKAFEHQRFNFGQLIRHLPLPRDPSRVPLISCTFNLNPPHTDLRFAGVEHELSGNPRAAYQFDLSFTCFEEDGDLRVDCDFNTDLFDAATIRRWLAHYRTMLKAIVSAPETPLCKLPLITAEERARLLEFGKGPANEFPADAGLAALFSRRAATQPDATAVIDGGRRLTYAEIEQRANQVANHLVGAGLKPGQFVGVRGECSARFVWEILGVLRAGGAYVPVPDDEPAERLKWIRQSCAVLLPDAAVYEGASTAPVDRKTDATSPAYLLFTSGSTGTPKGVVVPHRAVTRLVWNTDYVTFREDDVVAFASNPNFDATTFEIWGALLNGGALVVTPRDTLLSPDALARHIEWHHITVMFLTTSLFNRLAHEAPAMFAPLRTLVFGGEAADAASIRLVLEHGKPRTLVNGYGPTETTTFAVCHTIGKLDGDAVPIGRPIANTSVFILDGALQPSPMGVPGEIHIGGPGVALGYHEAPELTAAKFPTTEFGRLYRTGDLARWLADGTIEYLGRRDSQVKLRGFRIELGEIESALKRHPQVRQAAVVAQSQNGHVESLSAFVVPQRGQRADNEELRKFLTQHLPAHMIPSAFVCLEALPLTANGKLDTRMLPPPNTGSGATESIAPRNNDERRVAEIWSRVLRRPAPSVREDFFASGGHSLLALRMLSEIRREIGVEIPAQRLFETPTIEGLAAFVTEHSVFERRPGNFLVQIQRGESSTPPLFLIPGGWGGETEFLVYGGLSRQIDPAMPVWGLRARGTRSGELPHMSVSEMAGDYVREIRRVQPHGPYRIAGECVGGICAYEIASLLEKEGEEVALLVLLDTVVPAQRHLKDYIDSEAQRQAAEARRASMPNRIRHHLRKMSGLSLGKKIGYIFSRLLNRGKTGRPAEAPVVEQHPRGQKDYPITLLRHTLESAYHGTVTLLIDEESSQAHGKLGWDKMPLGHLETHILPGTHLSYIRENAATTAAKLREIIAQANTNFQHATAAA